MIDGDVSVQGLSIASGALVYVSWALANVSISSTYVQVKGTLMVGSEACPFQGKARLTLSGAADGPLLDGFAVGPKALVVGSGGVLDLHGAKGLSSAWTQLADTAQAGSDTISLVDGVAGVAGGWSVGDTVLLATTDWDPTLMEERTIRAVQDTHTVRLNAPLTWQHYGRVTMGSDQRGEVALVTRNIVVSAPVDATGFGAQIMGLTGARMRLEGVEVRNGGGNDTGRYPIHFHLLGDGTGSYARANAVVDSNFRAIVLHATHNVRVERNVAARISGHAIYVEDGVESGNAFVSNLVMDVRPKAAGPHIGSDIDDSGLAGFWITNPNNTFEGNVVAGTIGTGYWILTRNGPTGPSSFMAQYKGLNPSKLPLVRFANNRAHSCGNGLQSEATNFDSDNSPPFVNSGNPVTTMLAPLVAGQRVPIVVSGFQAHHCSVRGVWARVMWWVLDGGVFADNVEGVQLANTGDHPARNMQYMQGLTFVGFSNNTGNNIATPYQRWDSGNGCSAPLHSLSNRIGVKVYDGPQILRDSVFWRYPSLPGGNAAMGVRHANRFMTASTNAVQRCSFGGDVQRRVYDEDTTMDGGFTFSVRDDGSVTGYAGATVLPNMPFYAAANCKADTTWGLVCPHTYANFWVMDMTGLGQVTNPLTLTRSMHTDTAHSTYSVTLGGFANSAYYRYQPLLALGGAYLLRWGSYVPSAIAFQLNNANLGDSVDLALCYPAGSAITAVYPAMLSILAAHCIRHAQTQPCSLSARLPHARPLVSLLAHNTIGTPRDASCLYVWCSAKQTMTRQASARRRAAISCGCRLRLALVPQTAQRLPTLAQTARK